MLKGFVGGSVHDNDGSVTHTAESTAVKKKNALCPWHEGACV